MPLATPARNASITADSFMREAAAAFYRAKAGREGDPRSAIVDEADEWGADLTSSEDESLV